MYIKMSCQMYWFRKAKITRSPLYICIPQVLQLLPILATAHVGLPNPQRLQTLCHWSRLHRLKIYRHVHLIRSLSRHLDPSFSNRNLDRLFKPTLFFSLCWKQGNVWNNISLSSFYSSIFCSKMMHPILSHLKSGHVVSIAAQEMNLVVTTCLEKRVARPVTFQSTTAYLPLYLEI